MAELVASCKELLADSDTPVSAYRKLCKGEEKSFLFESGEAVENIGRHSIVCWDPLSTLILKEGRAEVMQGGHLQSKSQEEFFSLARQTLAGLECKDLPRLPFVGSFMGYVGFDSVRLMEKLPPAKPHHLPWADLSFPTRFVVFDHLTRMMTLVALAQDRAGADEKLKDIQDRLNQPLANPLSGGGFFKFIEPPQERFVDAVKRAKEFILAGDIFQVVLSDQFTGETDLDPLDVYRYLRVKSPSPYMFYLDLGRTQLAGASPETMVKVVGEKVFVRPIAGTRGRSSDPARDRELEREMMASEKERAEHVMLVDLSRNDVGRVSEYGSVRVDPYMTVERYSHVMHIVSQVEGRLRPGMDAWDAFMAGFPAGTVSGAPKVRAMEIIDELEERPRGPYAGAVGFFGPGHQTDTCIAIRFIQFEEGRFTLQAGAGIVADSDPEMEYREIQSKAAQGIAALGMAGEALR